VLFVPPYTAYVTTTFKVQKGSKEVLRAIYMTYAVSDLTSIYEETQVLCLRIKIYQFITTIKNYPKISLRNISHVNKNAL